MKVKAAFITKDLDTQLEGFRATLNLIIQAVDISFIILDHKLDPNLIESDDYQAWHEFFHEELEGPAYSNVKENEKYGFEYKTIEEIGENYASMILSSPSRRSAPTE